MSSRGASAHARLSSSSAPLADVSPQGATLWAGPRVGLPGVRRRGAQARGQSGRLPHTARPRPGRSAPHRLQPPRSRSGPGVRARRGPEGGGEWPRPRAEGLEVVVLLLPAVHPVQGSVGLLQVPPPPPPPAASRRRGPDPPSPPPPGTLLRRFYRSSGRCTGPCTGLTAARARAPWDPLAPVRGGEFPPRGVASESSSRASLRERSSGA